MANPRITTKERNLIKGAIRRVFSRSDLRKEALQNSVVQYIDSSRPRVKKWSVCPQCKNHTPTYQMEVDHQLPVIPIDKSLEQIDWNTLVDNIWCDITNLKAICESCHKIKSKAENKLRREYKKLAKKL